MGPFRADGWRGVDKPWRTKRPYRWAELAATAVNLKGGTDMTTREVPSQEGDPASGEAEDRGHSGPAPESVDVAPAPPRLDGEVIVREREGLPADAIVLVPVFAPPPMRCPDDVWAMLVVAADMAHNSDPDHAGELALFAGSWISQQPSADLHDGDLVIHLAPPPTSRCPADEHTTDIEMLLARNGMWQRVGHWCSVDDRWPHLVAPVAVAVMTTHNDDDGDTYQSEHTPVPDFLPPIRRRRGLAALLEAGLVKPGDDFVWDRPSHGVRHTVRVRADGVLVLADGRTFASPSGALTALGARNQSGWGSLRRASDGRYLSELRNEFNSRRGPRSIA